MDQSRTASRKTLILGTKTSEVKTSEVFCGERMRGVQKFNALYVR